MLTAKQNMQEVLRGGKPERFVNQFEAVYLLFHPYVMQPGGLLQKGDVDVLNAWGVTNSFPENTPGQFPVHTPEKIVVKDIEKWRDYVHAPSVDYPPEVWAQFKASYDEVDGTQAYKATFVAPGLFEQTHHLCEISNALEYFITNPDEMHELINYLADWEIELAKGICEHLKPDAIFHHDDWGSAVSTFLRPEMFAEFFVEPYKRIYGYYKDHGVDIIIHHSDSFAATLVPYMIEMGIDVFQGCTQTNNVPELIKQYGGKISFMGAIDNKLVDYDDWKQEDIAKVVRDICDACGEKYFIPCIIQGGPGSVYPGVYMALTEEIDKYSVEKFGIKPEDITRLPVQLIF